MKTQKRQVYRSQVWEDGSEGQEVNVGGIVQYCSH